MISLAARIGRALSLHSELSVSSFPQYESQLRRRLWHNICVMDVQFAFDRAAEPMIDETTYTTHPPANVADIRASPSKLSGSSPDTSAYSFGPEAASFTSTFFLLMQIEASSMASSLNFYSDGDGLRRSHEADRDWRRRMDKVDGYKRGMHERYARHLDPGAPFHRFMKAALDITTTVMLLVALRPMQRHPDVPPPNIESAKVLRIAVGVLDKSNAFARDAAFAPWRWFLWVQWHSLAVAIAELCVKDHGAYADHVWPAVDGAYEYLSRDVADSERGLLWRPILKLMKKARSLRHDFALDRPGGQGDRLSFAPQSLTAPSRVSASTEALPSQMPMPVDMRLEALSPRTAALPSLQYQDWSFDQYAFEDMSLQTVTWPSDQTATAWNQWGVFMDEFGEVQG